MTNYKDYTEGNVVDKILKPPVQAPKADVPPTKDPNARTPFFDSGNGKLLGFQYADGRVALEKGSISNNALDAQGKPVYRPSGMNDTPPAPTPQAPPTTAQILQETGIGMINQSLSNQQSTDIARNQALAASLPLNNIGNPNYNPALPAGVETNKGLGLLPPINKIAGVFIKGSKASLIKNSGLNKDVQAYLSDYSNEASFESIKDNIALSEAHIKVALNSANAGEDPANAIKLYNAAQSEKYLAMRQLKLLSKDQKAYVSDVRSLMTELETYFSDLKRYDDAAMARAVSGVQNG